LFGHVAKNVYGDKKKMLSRLFWSAVRAPNNDILRNNLMTMETDFKHNYDYFKNYVDSVCVVRSKRMCWNKCTSSIAESENSVNKKLRSYPPFFMVSKIYDYWNKKVINLAEEYTNTSSQFPEKVSSELKKAIDGGLKLRFTFISGKTAQVESESTQGLMHAVRVDSQSPSCSCGCYRLSGVPCKHMAMLASYCEVKVEDLVHPLLGIDAIRKSYTAAMPIHPVATEGMISDNLLPPLMKQQPGRPKKKRIRSCMDDSISDPTRCGYCHQIGHNIRTCSEKRQQK